MKVAVGTSLGPYTILSPLGKGGMGEVYRAQDTRLHRVVAIKILKPALSDDRAARLRLEREARALSSLSHPNVCCIFDIGDQEGVAYLVMEYLEGMTLAKRLRRGALPFSEVVQYGCQIAAALESAHHHGIIHRDLKPGNIILTKSGVKVLDFGLATDATPAKVEDGMDGLAPTIDERLTRVGGFIGTVPYMAPELLNGKEADARSDIFALGLVIYEMATGQVAFPGDSQAGVIANILKTEPPSLTSFQIQSVSVLEPVVRGCLAKDPEGRWDSAHDVKLQLQAILAGPVVTEIAASPRASRKWKTLAVLGAAATLLLAAGLVFVTTHAGERRVLATAILQPSGHVFVFMGPFGPPAFSPDAKTIAFTAAAAGTPPQIWIRQLDSETATMLAGTEGGYYPFWSPDGKYLAFFSGTKLMKIAVDGGSPITICDTNLARGGSWNRDGVIIFGKFAGGIYQVPSSGGTPSPVTKLDDSRHDSTNRWPEFLPDGDHFLYMASSFGPESDANAIFMGSLKGDNPKLVLKASSNAYYAAGQLFYVRESTIVAQPFNPTTGTLSGEATSLVQNVAYDATTSDAAFRISSAGDLAFQPGTSQADFQLMLVDAKGKPARTLGEPGVTLNPRISPDGKRVLASLIDRRSGQSDVWAYDLERSTRTRLTFGGIRNNDPIWSPNGNAIAYSSYRSGHWSLFTRPADGAGEDKLVYQGAETPMSVATSFEVTHFVHNEPISPTSWTADLKHILFSQRLGNGQWIVALASTDGQGAVQPVLKATGANFRDGELSPDGNWIAYESDESGHDEIYMSMFPSLKHPQQVSVGGGVVPRWQRNGKALCYLRGDRNVTCADLEGAGASLHVTTTHPMFPLGLPVPFDVSGDGRQFVLSTTINMQNPAPLTVITNWLSRIKR